MIAPTNFSQELELYLYLSSKVQVAFKLPVAQFFTGWWLCCAAAGMVVVVALWRL